jgi:hypothetical protein
MIKDNNIEEEFNIVEDEYSNDEYAKVYGSLYTDKIKELKDTINSQKTMDNEYNVFALEAGLGKSRAMIRVIDENLQDWDNNLSYLIVRRFKQDIFECEKYLEHHNNPLLTKVLGITSVNWNEWHYKLDKLQAIRVLIISHQRYINLCLDDELRQAFMNNREVLIIDEKVNFPIYTYSKKTYDEVRSLLHSSIQKDFDKACSPLLKELMKRENDKEKNKVLRCDVKIHPKTLENFKKIMEVNIENEKNMNHKNTLKHFMEGLDQWYNTKCVYNGGNISTFNRNHKLWGLKNNIILDASAGIDGIYNLGKFNVIGKERIIDHSNSKFIIVNFNSSKSQLRNNQSKFYPEICEKIKTYHKPFDKTLIICHKDNHKAILEQLYKSEITKIGLGDEEYQGEEFVINWFGNLIGKNEYSAFTQCWIIGTPNIPYEQYLVNYMMFKQDDLGRKSTDIVLGRFTNDEFLAVQTGYIASEIYQSIKRIQRNEMPQGEFYIVNSDQQIVSMVLSQIKGTDNVKITPMDFQQKDKVEKKKDNVDKLVDYIYGLPKGIYRKKAISDAIDVTNFNRMLTDARIKALLPTPEIGLGMIMIHNKHIEKLTEPIELEYEDKLGEF